jgi:hypothetical protein
MSIPPSKASTSSTFGFSSFLGASPAAAAAEKRKKFQTTNIIFKY